MEFTAAGTLIEVIYMGDVTKYYVRLTVDTIITAKRHNREGAFKPAVGDNVYIWWEAMKSVVV